jgi:hypothetical protein
MAAISQEEYQAIVLAMADRFHMPVQLVIDVLKYIKIQRDANAFSQALEQALQHQEERE